MTHRKKVGSCQSHHRRSQSLVGLGRPLPSFLKLILPCILKDQKLRIPEKFAKKFGEELSGVAKVVDPTGHAWEIRLTKVENNIWLDDGWQKFAEHHSIGFGYVVVFKYGGLSNFSAHIFDTSACEIQYRRSGPASGEEINYSDNCLVHNAAEMEDDGPIKLSDSTISSPSDASKSGVSGKGASKRKYSRRNSLAEQNLGTKKLHSCAASQASPSSKHLGDKVRKKHMEEEFPVTRELDGANESRKKLHSCVAVQGSPSLEHLGDKMSRKHMEEEPPLIIVLDDANESRKKLQNCVVAPKSSSYEQLGDRMSKMHMEEEYLETIVLDGANESRNGKLLNKHQISARHGSLFNETKADYRKTKIELSDNELQSKLEEDVEAVVCRFPNASQASKTAILAAEMFKPKNPFFVSLLQPYNLSRCFMNVPHGIAKRYLTGASDNIKLKVSDEREWPAKLAAKNCLISKGWHAFHTENDLKVGDVCVFEVIKSSNVEFKVTIFRADEGSSSKKSL